MAPGALVRRIGRLRLGGWKAGGHRSCARWLTLRTGRAPGTAREQVRAARGWLKPEVGALVMRALEKATDALYREEERDGAKPLSPRARRREAARRRVDPGPLDPGARWKREPDIPDRVYFGVLEAGFASRSPP